MTFPDDTSRLATAPNAGPGAPCAWCGEPIPPVSKTGRKMRADAETCSKEHRQARHRFKIGRADQVLDVSPGGARRLRLAYADPPYPALARRYYDCEEVDHAQLVERLVAQYPDGWALSTSAAALTRAPAGSAGVPAGGVIELCPPGTRVCVWLKGARAARARQALNAWEPLLVYGGRQGVVEDLHDALIWGGRQHSHPGALVGMKPAAFCEWMFRLLGAAAGDTLDDLFPGSGAVGRAWRLYTSPGPNDDASRVDEASRLAGAARRLRVLAGERVPQRSASAATRRTSRSVPGQLDILDALDGAA
jgi:hypothetical protein